VSGWIGVDLDGTLARYEGFSKNGYEIGEPIQPMLRRVITWLNNHQEVRVFTARVSCSGTDLHDQIRLIDEWCTKHIGKALPITNKKDFAMIELWDDRAVQVEMNTGRRMDGNERPSDGYAPKVETTPEPPTLRPGATIIAKQDTKSINGLNIPKGQILRVTAHSLAMITARIGEHGEGLVATVQPSYFEVIG